MIDMKTYRRLDDVRKDDDKHNIYVTVRGESRKAVFKAKEALEMELGDRVSWQVFMAEMSRRFLARPA